MPATAHSATSGERRMTSATSSGKTLRPPRLIMSEHPTLDPEEALGVDAAEVAGVEPAVDQALGHVVALVGARR